MGVLGQQGAYGQEAEAAANLVFFLTFAVVVVCFPAPVQPPVGWYEDPEGPGYNRWWDGQRWTEHRTQRPS